MLVEVDYVLALINLLVKIPVPFIDVDVDEQSGEEVLNDSDPKRAIKLKDDFIVEVSYEEDYFAKREMHTY